MRIYLDNCCYNRPYDDQTSLIIRLETEAKLHIQEQIRQGTYELVWSFILDYENEANPFKEVRNRIKEWKKLAARDCGHTDGVMEKASELMAQGLRQMDASHISCAIHEKADCFLTTDKGILKKNISGIEVMNPIDFVRRSEYAE